MKCIVKGCWNYSDAGTFAGVLCSPCYAMITTGVVHHRNPTFIGDLTRGVLGLNKQIVILQREVGEWKQAASVEAGLRRDDGEVD